MTFFGVIAKNLNVNYLRLHTTRRHCKREKCWAKTFLVHKFSVCFRLQRDKTSIARFFWFPLIRSSNFYSIPILSTENLLNNLKISSFVLILCGDEKTTTMVKFEMENLQGKQKIKCNFVLLVFVLIIRSWRNFLHWMTLIALGRLQSLKFFCLAHFSCSLLNGAFPLKMCSICC